MTTFFGEKFPFSRPKKCPIRPFLRKKNHYFKQEILNKTVFFTLFILSHTSNNTTSLNIGGPMHGPSPHLKFFWGTVPPVLPPGLRPWGLYIRALNGVEPI